MTVNGAAATANAHVGAHAATATIDSPTTPPTAVHDVLLHTAAGPDGPAGSCRVAPADNGLGSVQSYCAHSPTPLRIPANLVGLDLFEAMSSSRELGCVDTDAIHALAPDGHDATTDTEPAASRWRIASIVRSAGALPTHSPPVVVRVTAAH